MVDDFFIMENKTPTRLDRWKVGVPKGVRTASAGIWHWLLSAKAVRTPHTYSNLARVQPRRCFSYIAQKASFLYKKDLFTMLKIVPFLFWNTPMNLGILEFS